jgi:hypothetical protein
VMPRPGFPCGLWEHGTTETDRSSPWDDETWSTSSSPWSAPPQTPTHLFLTIIRGRGEAPLDVGVPTHTTLQPFAPIPEISAMLVETVPTHTTFIPFVMPRLPGRAATTSRAYTIATEGPLAPNAAPKPRHAYASTTIVAQRGGGITPESTPLGTATWARAMAWRAAGATVERHPCWSGRGAWSQRGQSSLAPRQLSRPVAVSTQGRSVHGS